MSKTKTTQKPQTKTTDAKTLSAKSKVSRNPSIELLRILMMLQIIFLHVSDYGDYTDIAQELSGRVELTYWIIWLLCRCPVYIFVIIMGYFLCETKTDFNYRRVFKCYIPMLFYSVMIPVIYGLFRPGTVTDLQYIKGFFPFMSRTWYFMTLYLLVLILSPFLNKMIRNLTRNEFLYLLAICFFVFSIWQPLSMLEPFESIISLKKILSTQGGKSLYDFIYMYLLGAYLRKHHIFTSHENKKDKNLWNSPFIYLGGFLLMGLIDVWLVYNYPDKGIEGVVGYNDNPLVVLQCTCLFRFFEKLDLSRFPKAGFVINAISAGNLGIYMIHEHPLIRNLIWEELFPLGTPKFYMQKNYLLQIVLVILIIYCACWVIDAVVRYMGRLVKKLVLYIKS